MTKVRVKRLDGGGYQVWINDFEVPDVASVELDKIDGFGKVSFVKLTLLADFEANFSAEPSQPHPFAKNEPDPGLAGLRAAMHEAAEHPEKARWREEWAGLTERAKAEMEKWDAWRKRTGYQGTQPNPDGRYPGEHTASGKAVMEAIRAGVEERRADDWDDLRGAAPDATGGLSSEDYVRKLREEWD